MLKRYIFAGLVEPKWALVVGIEPTTLGWLDPKWGSPKSSERFLILKKTNVKREPPSQETSKYQ